SVNESILMRESSLPRVGHGTAVRHELVSPRVRRTLETSARREFPFGFGRQLLPFPARERFGVVVRDVDDRMVVEAGGGAAGPLRMTPVGAVDEAPPVGDVVEIDRTLRPHE